MGNLLPSGTCSDKWHALSISVVLLSASRPLSWPLCAPDCSILWSVHTSSWHVNCSHFIAHFSHLISDFMWAKVWLLNVAWKLCQVPESKWSFHRPYQDLPLVFPEWDLQSKSITHLHVSTSFFQFTHPYGVRSWWIWLCKRFWDVWLVSI